MSTRLLIVSPIRNEAAHIERVAASLDAQSVRPDRWIVVDDGSTDETPSLLRRLERELDFMHVYERSADPGAVVDRLAVAAEARAFNEGLQMASDVDFTHVLKLDGDIELPPHYFKSLFERFAADPQLGLAGGNLIEPRGGRMVRLSIPKTHVHGAVKCYTRACFEAIGGLQNRLGWDTIDETYARMRGFRTESFADLVAIHHRPHASADGTLRGRARHGECAYVAHFPVGWIALRSLKIARSNPIGVSGVAFFYGYARAAVRRVEQVPDREFRRFARRELRQRMRGAVLGGLPRRPRPAQADRSPAAP